MLPYKISIQIINTNLGLTIVKLGLANVTILNPRIMYIIQVFFIGCKPINVIEDVEDV